MQDDRTKLDVISDEITIIRKVIWAYVNTVLTMEQKQEFLRSFNDPANDSPFEENGDEN